MFWKKTNETEKKLTQMNDILKRSFANVKRDTSNIFRWLNYFYRKSLEQGQTIKRLEMELSYMPRTREDIKKIIDEYYSFESVIGKIKELDRKVDDLAKKPQQVEKLYQPAPQEVQMDISYIQRRLEKLEQKKPSIKEEIIKRLTRNSKEYVKSVMLSYIKKYEKISALQLKEIVVDEQHLCSKSSFYRLLEEVEELDDIAVIKQGKEKHYFSKALKRV